MAATLGLERDGERLWNTTLVFDRVMQERGDRFVLRAAILDHCGADSHQVTEIRHGGTLADMSAMDVQRVSQRAFEFLAQMHWTAPPAPENGR